MHRARLDSMFFLGDLMSSPISGTHRVAVLCVGIAGALGLAAMAASSQTFAARVVSGTSTVITAPAANDVLQTLAARHSHTESGQFTFAKARLSYDANSPKCMYLFLPGIGTAVISVGPDGKAIFSPVTLHQDELTFNADDHHLNLSGVDLHTGRSTHPAHLSM